MAISLHWNLLNSLLWVLSINSSQKVFIAFNCALYSWFISESTKFLPSDMAKSFYTLISFFIKILKAFSQITITRNIYKKKDLMPTIVINSS